MATITNALMDEWIDIETAPTDGTIIDIWARGYGRIADCGYSDGHWRYWGVDVNGSMDFVSIEPFVAVKWRPLPSTPFGEEVGY